MKKEKREKEFQSIKARITEDFHQQIALERENLRKVTDHLNYIMEENKRKDDQISRLMKKLDENEKQTVDILRDDLAKMKNDAAKEKQLIKELQKNKERSEELQRQLIDENNAKIAELKTSFRKELDEMKNSYSFSRDQTREDIEKEKKGCNIL